MGGVIIRRQDAAENLAGPVADLAQEGALVRVTVPAAQQRDMATVGQVKSGNVDGLGAGMAAPAA